MFPDLLRRETAAFLSLSDEQVQRLESHYRELVRWNKVLNLTRVESLESAVQRHYAESLFLASHLPPGPLRVADVGSGPGFPGVPVAVARPDCSVTLIESHQRKAVFLRESTRGWANIRVVSKRVEEVQQEFDWVVMRAVAWVDVASVVRRIAPHVAILGGESLDGAFERLRLPWGDNRFLYVSRDTSPIRST